MKRAKLLLLPLLAPALMAETVPADIHDGGICIGLGWATLQPGEKVEVEHGPDFYVYYFSSSDDASAWGVYLGSAAQVTGNGPTLLKRDGLKIKRADKDGEFRGYLVQQRYSQNHFFGSALKGTKADRAFFDRVDFGETGKALCRKAKG